MAANRKATSIRFSDEEMALLDKVAKDRKISKTAALVAGLNALASRETVSQEAVIDWIRTNTKARAK